MTENTKKHDSCKYGKYINSHPKKSRGCIHSGGLCRLSKNQCLNCEYFEKKNDFVDVWLDFFEKSKTKN